MARSRSLTALALVAAAVVVALIAGLAGSWVGRLRALEGLSFVDVSADMAAQAMYEDHFYSDYGGRAVIVHGTVASVQPRGSGSRIALRTSAAMGVTCDVPTTAGLPVPGESIVVVSPGGSALREPAAVSFPDCRVFAAP